MDMLVTEVGPRLCERRTSDIGRYSI